MGMTMEEEIKARLENGGYMDPGKFLDRAPDDIEYLLARNEELQRRVEKYKVLEEAVRIFHSPICGCPMCAALDELDDKEQHDATPQE